MVVYNYSGKEINAKIVYYGPALSGKTTNLEWIYSKIPTEYSGKMVSLRTQADRTIFFDFLPLELGLIDGFKTRFMLYTVPGQVYYNATRKMVLKGVDGVVFVADSEIGRLEDNLESFQNLKDNLTELGIDPSSLPMALQWNKRDLTSVEEVSRLEQEINEYAAPSFEASAPTGQGVYETLHRISQVVYQKLTLGDQAAGQDAAVSDAPEDSLFGAAIAAKLQEIDHPIHHERLAIDDVDSEEPADETPILDSILGGGGTPAAAPQTNQAAEDKMAGSVRNETPQQVPVTPQGEPAMQQAPTAQAPGASESEGEAMVSQLVDEVLGQLDDGPFAETEAPAPPIPPVAQAPQQPQAQPSDDFSDIFEETARANPEDQVPIEHDVDPFEAVEEQRTQGETAPEEDLGLITDPLKRSSTPSRSGDADPANSGAFPAAPSDAKILEIPVTVDVDALKEGRPIKIILNLRG
jgi:signal recognition particle receptor subunit beta